MRGDAALTRRSQVHQEHTNEVTELLGRAAQHHGLVATGRSFVAALDRRRLGALLRSLHFERHAAGVQRVVGAPTTLTQARIAAVLSAGPNGRLGGLSSAHLLRLVDTRPPDIEVVVPYATTVQSSHLRWSPDPGDSTLPIRMRRTLRLDPVDHGVVDDIPCLSAERTIIECARHRWMTIDMLESMLDRGRRAGIATVDRLAERIAVLGGRGAHGCPKVRAVVERQRGIAAAESELETRLWQLLRRRTFAQSDEPERQVDAVRSDGLAARIDVAWRHLGLGIEAEGWEWHEGRLRWKQDKRRAATLESAGWRLVVVTWDDVVHRPGETLARIEQAYRERRRLAA
jgi:very-short-patch-repair endonuclease